MAADEINDDPASENRTDSDNNNCSSSSSIIIINENNHNDTNQQQQEDNNSGDHDQDDDFDDWKIQRDASKQLGDEAFRSGKYNEAIQHYSEALSVDPDYAVVYSNRSACYMKIGEKSRALRDAQECVALGFGTKGFSRLAAALQSLQRYQPATENWKLVLKDDPQNVAALQGLDACQKAISEQREKEALEQQQAAADEAAEADSSNAKDSNEDKEVDDLDDFFNDVESAAMDVVKQKQQLAAETHESLATNAIKNHKKDLGTAQQQIDRLLQPNYQWKNLNPFNVLELSHTATKDDISRRYKALSLLLHPDKNRTPDVDDNRIQEAYDQVLKAKAQLDDETKANHVRQLIEQGLKQGRMDWERGNRTATSLEEAQSKAVQKIFAQIEYNRREVEQRERNHEQREREKEEAEAEHLRNERKRDKNWQQEERVEGRIGSWRHFQKSKKPKV